MEFASYLSIARRWWWTLLVSTWVAALAGFLLGSQIPPTYESRVRVLVGPVNADLNTIRASGFLVLTYAELAVSQPLIESTITELGLSDDPSSLRRRIHTTANDSTRLLTVTVDDGDPKRAAAIANGLVNELVQFAGRGISRPEGELTVTDFAEVPTSPTSPNLPLVVVLAGAAGLLGALVLVVLLEHLNPSVSSESDLAGVVGVPVLASINRIHANPGSAGAKDQASEIPLLTARIRFGDGGRERRVIGVAGTSPGDGSAELIWLLATSLGAAGLKPIIIDANSSERRITTEAGALDRPGLSEQLAYGTALSGTAAEDDGRVTVLGHGRLRLDSPTIESRLGPMLRALSATHHIVLIHLDPALSSAAVAVARTSDGVVVAVRTGSARPSAVERGVGVLESAQVTVLGTVLHDLRARRLPRAAPPTLLEWVPATPKPNPSSEPATQETRPARSSRSRSRRTAEQRETEQDSKPAVDQYAHQDPPALQDDVERGRRPRPGPMAPGGRSIPRIEPE